MSLAGHIFIHSPEGQICKTCRRLWCHVVAQQPSWPDYRRRDDEGNLLPDPISEGIACVGSLTSSEEVEIDKEKRRVWEALCEAAGHPLRSTVAETEEEPLMGYCG